MISAVVFKVNIASEAEIEEHLSDCDSHFVPRLSERVKINEYAKKIATKAMRFEAWCGAKLVGLVAAYCNDKETYISYITSVSVLRNWIGKRIAFHLMERCVDYAKKNESRLVVLEVGRDNRPAIKLYEKMGFVMSKSNEVCVSMTLNLNMMKL